MENIAYKQLKQLLKTSPPNNEYWQEVVDFTKIKEGGIKIDEILSRL
ncbi:MAG: hypothetical protein U9O66_00880 [Patescibacteria group bacterium]|nr:hypothetical protein [Patescibacteria group bacterium]